MTGAEHSRNLFTLTDRYDTSRRCCFDGHCGVILLKKKVLGWLDGFSNHNKEQIYDISLGCYSVDAHEQSKQRQARAQTACAHLSAAKSYIAVPCGDVARLI